MRDTVLLVVHQLRSDPGRVALRLRTMGYRLHICRHACGDALPDCVENYAAVMVFGGPMSANDDHEDFIRAELDWIPTVVETGVPFLGICLGAQLFARCLGAHIAPHPEGFQEIGYFPIRPTAAGAGDFPPEMQVFQWHKEGFQVPPCADLLATGDIYENQAFRYGRNAYGIQFHPEVTEAINRLWGTGSPHRLKEPGAQPMAEQFEKRQRYDPYVDQWLDGFLRNLLASGHESETLVVSEPIADGARGP